MSFSFYTSSKGHRLVKPAKIIPIFTTITSWLRDWQINAELAQAKKGEVLMMFRFSHTGWQRHSWLKSFQIWCAQWTWLKIWNGRRVFPVETWGLESCKFVWHGDFIHLETKISSKRNVTSIVFPNNNCRTVKGCKIIIRVWWLNRVEDPSVWKESANTIRLATTVKSSLWCLFHWHWEFDIFFWNSCWHSTNRCWWPPRNVVISFCCFSTSALLRAVKENESDLLDAMTSPLGSK